jgi:hypothetical protein
MVAVRRHHAVTSLKTPLRKVPVGTLDFGRRADDWRFALRLEFGRKTLVTMGDRLRYVCGGIGALRSSDSGASVRPPPINWLALNAPDLHRHGITK